MRTSLESAVLLAGVGRSGTTWLGEVLNHDGRYASYFEPMHPKRAPEFAADLPPFAYIPREAPALPRITPWLSLLLNGSPNPWINRDNPNPSSPHVLIKAIRACLLLPWLQRALPFLRVVLIVRHPLAVLHSRRAMGWRGNLDRMLHQPGLVDVLPGALTDRLNRPDDVTHHVGQWVLQTVVPIRELDPARTHVVFYEDLVRDGGRELKRIERFLGVDLGAGAQAALGVPSDMARDESAVHTGDDKLRRWMEAIPAEERAQARPVLEAAGLIEVYDPDDPLPRIDPADLLAVAPRT